MNSQDETYVPWWPLWQRILFRFFFVYLLLQIAPWNWIPFPRFFPILRWIGQGTDFAVQTANAHLFHVRDTLIKTNGSGDTSWAYAQFELYLTFSVFVCVVWSLLDRKRVNYRRLDYWFRTIVRYSVATYALSYGIIKLFALQMAFPTISQLATPLGDLLPMRLSWLFLGYSPPYQTFSGVIEVIAGLLLLNRRTITLGLIVAAGAFVNVLMINLSYDVPVKLFASHMMLACSYLLATDARRLTAFFLLNRAVPGTLAYEPNFARPWQRYTAMAVKAGMILLILLIPLNKAYQRSQRLANTPPARPFRTGVYNVVHYAVNGDTLPAVLSDSIRWRDVIFDNNDQGSVNTTDPVFWQRYRRGYFRYRADTTKHTVAVWKTSTVPGDSTWLFSMRYETPDTSSIRFWTKIRNDSVYVELARTPRHFQLAERQFHWLSEFVR